MSDFRYRNRDAPKLAFAGLLAVLGLVILIIGGRLWGAQGDYRAEVIRSERLIERADESRAGGGSISFGETAFYRAETPQAAQAQLQSDMQQLADQHALSIEVMQPGEIEARGDLLRIPLTLNGAISERTLGQFFADLMARQPYVIVEEYAVRRQRGVRPGSGPRLVSLSVKLYAMTAR